MIRIHRVIRVINTIRISRVKGVIKRIIWFVWHLTSSSEPSKSVQFMCASLCKRPGLKKLEDEYSSFLLVHFQKATLFSSFFPQYKPKYRSGRVSYDLLFHEIRGRVLARGKCQLPNYVVHGL